MVAGHNQAALQPNGTTMPEETFSVQHVADAIVHIASLPLNVTILEMNIMQAFFLSFDHHHSLTSLGLLRCRLLAEGEDSVLR